MELDFVAWLRERLPPARDGAIGVGDDAALLPLEQPGWVITTDLLIDGVHFDTAEHAPERIGRKALAANLSDLAAMAAGPVGAVVSIALPRSAGANADTAKRLIEGMLPLCEQFDCPIIGGDTNTGPGPLVVSVAAFGAPHVRGPLCRDGARPGDRLLVTGELGGSLLGRHLDFTPRVEEAMRLHGEYNLHAGMDLTDGLGLDLGRMISASGVGAVLEADAIPIAAAAEQRSKATGRTSLEHAISDGEDFELLLAAPVEVAQRLIEDAPLACGLAIVGEITERTGLEIRDHQGQITPLEAKGYEHL